MVTALKACVQRLKNCPINVSYMLFREINIAVITGDKVVMFMVRVLGQLASKRQN